VLLAELVEVLPRAKFAKRVAAAQISVERLARRYARLARSITPAEIRPTALADIDDDAVIACALGAGADLIISGDKRLRNIKTYHGISIVSVDEVLTRLPQR
jgi:predicted nucleic acid-binding protein